MKNKKRNIIFALLVIVTICFSLGCGGENNPMDQYGTYKITHYFEQADGEYQVDSTLTKRITEEKDKTVTAEPVTRNGYIVDKEIQGYKDSGVIDPEKETELNIYYSYEKFTLTFDTDGGSEIKAVETKHSKHVNIETEPTKENFVFGGWYKDKECKNSFNGIMPEKDTTIYAHWIKKENFMEIKGSTDKDYKAYCYELDKNKYSESDILYVKLAIKISNPSKESLGEYTRLYLGTDVLCGFAANDESLTSLKSLYAWREVTLKIMPYNGENKAFIDNDVSKFPCLNKFGIHFMYYDGGNTSAFIEIKEITTSPKVISLSGTSDKNIAEGKCYSLDLINKHFDSALKKGDVVDVTLNFRISNTVSAKEWYPRICYIGYDTKVKTSLVMTEVVETSKFNKIYNNKVTTVTVTMIIEDGTGKCYLEKKPDAKYAENTGLHFMYFEGISESNHATIEIMEIKKAG